MPRLALVLYPVLLFCPVLSPCFILLQCLFCRLVLLRCSAFFAASFYFAAVPFLPLRFTSLQCLVLPPCFTSLWCFVLPPCLAPMPRFILPLCFAPLPRPPYCLVLWPRPTTLPFPAVLLVLPSCLVPLSCPILRPCLAFPHPIALVFFIFKKRFSVPSAPLPPPSARCLNVLFFRICGILILHTGKNSLNVRRENKT